jgi:hypothetical protein
MTFSLRIIIPKKFWNQKMEIDNYWDPTLFAGSFPKLSWSADGDKMKKITGATVVNEEESRLQEGMDETLDSKCDRGSELLNYYQTLYVTGNFFGFSFVELFCR